MKKYIKVICSCFVLLSVMLSIFSCGNKYKDDVKSETIANAVAEKLSVEGGYTVSDSDSFKYDFKEPSYVDDYIIMFAKSGTNMNRFGIFHVNDKKSVDDMKEIVTEYVEKYKTNFNYDYLPLENPKIEGGTVKTYGNYVVFMFLTDSDQTTAENQISELLNK